MRGRVQDSAHERSAGSSLIFRAKELLCALPLASVEEIMRPLPVKALEGVPLFVSGISVIRGAPVPVVNAGSLLSGGNSFPTRFIALRLGNRRVALAVDEILGIRAIPAAMLGILPPLLRDAQRDTIDSVGTLDEELLLVLRSGQLVPDSVWSSIESQGASP